MITDQLLGLLKIVLLIALYAFFARVLWAVWHEIRTPAINRASINVVDVPAPMIERPRVGRAHRVERLCIVAPAELKGTVIPLNGSELLIGRGDDCALQLPAHTGASVRHARIISDDGYATIEDLGSTNKTMVNGDVIDAPRRLRIGDRVYIGLVTLEARR